MKKRMVVETIKENREGEKLCRITCFEGSTRPTDFSYLVFVPKAQKFNFHDTSMVKIGQENGGSHDSNSIQGNIGTTV